MNDSNTTNPNQDIDNAYIAEAANRILADERTNPGSQDPDAVQWAANTVGGGSVPLPQAPQQAQPSAAPAPGQVPAPPTQNDDAGVLYIDRSSDNTAQPQDNGTTNGDNNGNSN